MCLLLPPVSTNLSLFICFQSLKAEKEKKRCNSGLPDIVEELSRVFASAIHAAFPSLKAPPVSVTISQNEKFGDYQCNSAMAISGVCSSTSLCDRNIFMKTILFEKNKNKQAIYLSSSLHCKFTDNAIALKLCHLTKPPAHCAGKRSIRLHCCAVYYFRCSMLLLNLSISTEWETVMQIGQCHVNCTSTVKNASNKPLRYFHFNAVNASAQLLSNGLELNNPFVQRLLKLMLLRTCRGINIWLECPRNEKVRQG